MYLKQIEVQGFKSFANKIVFEFGGGITGIVGPNGSGKSNIADAVRWVLGEQSARQLRGSRMEDVIFSGTQTRKPLGSASVSITLDNSDHRLPIDYDQVTVTRRVYRSGESEYLINGAACRLRDVQELFLDTGIGQEGYSIIGQGQIDKVLSGRPEERRELFDEAAGIVKFKKRKAAAEKNLEEERANLLRIEDILSEIEKQLGPLEKQSEKAREYLRLREELKQKELSSFLAQYERDQEAERELDQKRLLVSDELADARLEYDNTKEEYERLETELEQYSQRIEAMRLGRSEFDLSAQKLAGQIELLKEQISSEEQRKTQLNERLEQLAAEISRNEQQCRTELGRKNEIDEKLDRLDIDRSLAAEELNRLRDSIRDASEQVKERNSDIISILNENTTIKGSLQRYRTILEQNQIKKAQLSQKLLSNKSEEAECLEQVTQEKAKLKDLSSRILAQTRENEEQSRKMNEVQEEIDTLTVRFNESQKRYLSDVSRLESLRNIAERYEGYGGSIRRVMEKKKEYPGIHGVVADLIQTKKEYETAIEIALGGSIQNIVTDTEDTAKSLIEYLKKNRLGRATFLPLTSITDRSRKDPAVLSEEGMIGTADSLIRTADRYRTLAGFLLGRVYVADTIDHALRIARKYGYTLRIVTLEGEQLSPGGSLSGGAYKNASSLLGRRREIQELETAAAELEKETNGLLAAKEEKKALKARMRDDLEKNRMTLQGLYLEQNTARLSLSQKQAAYEACKGSYQEYADEIRLLDTQNSDLTQSLNKLTGDLDANQERQAKAEAEIASLNTLLKENQARELAASSMQEKRVLEFQSLEQSNAYIIETIRRIRGEIEKLTLERTQREEARDLADTVIVRKNQALKEEEERRRDALEQSQECRDASETLSVSREELTKNHRTFFQKREELSERISQMDKELYRLNAQKEKLRDTLDGLMDHIWQEYEITITAARELKIEKASNPASVKREIADLKAQMKELGTVNVNAIEDYRETKERFGFLSGQREDLIEAESSLMGVIRDLDGEMRKQFAEKFEQINRQFDRVFGELFGGGHGTLELIQEQDLLEAGVRVIAQPPGKKLQNMMQLSGGEKALTAIALLFAIQNLKPSPFCLLDEIEAALDDSNVKRFADYLHKLARRPHAEQTFTERTPTERTPTERTPTERTPMGRMPTDGTQFIIITHRRGTMAAADVLYGITMQEKGVSTLVSVSLVESQLEQ